MKKLHAAAPSVGFRIVAPGPGASRAQASIKMSARLDAAASILAEVIVAADHAISETMLDKSHCVIVLPSEKKAVFEVGAQDGRGAATCQTGYGWTAPVFVKPCGVGFALQVGWQSTDLSLARRNAESAQDMLHSKLQPGADASAEPCPTRRDAQAATNLTLSYSERLTHPVATYSSISNNWETMTSSKDPS